MALISMRVPRAMKAELERMAEQASAASGRRVSRAEVHRAITAEGIRRARIAGTYSARYAGQTTEASGE